MNSFVYCIDEQLKNKLISQGFKLLNQQDISGQAVWVFENNNEIIRRMEFDASNKNKFYFSNRLTF